MKKILSFVLALVMILSLSTVVFAADEETATDVVVTSQETTIKVTKEYSANADVFPAETLKFTSTPAADNPDGTNLVIDDVVAVGQSFDVIIDVPSFTKVGLYKFTIAEEAGDTQGVTYANNTISVSVLVEYDYEDEDQDGHTLKAIAGVTMVDNDKDDNFVNTYEVGSLEVSKVVTGNLGDREKKFDVTVTFSATGDVLSDITYEDGKIVSEDWKDGKAVVEIRLAHNEYVTFENIPAGVTYVVEEDDYAEYGYDAAKYEFSDDNMTIAKSDKDTVEITNNKETEVATGISLDSMPYIMILAVVAGAFVLTSFKKREV